MLPSKERLTRAQFSSLLSDPALRVVFNRLGTLKYIKTLENKGLSVVTGSKQQKKAVLRNKLRRRLYSIFATHYKNTTKQPLIGILYVSKHVYEMDFAELTNQFNDILAKTQKTP